MLPYRVPLAFAGHLHVSWPSFSDFAVAKVGGHSSPVTAAHFPSPNPGKKKLEPHAPHALLWTPFFAVAAYDPHPGAYFTVTSPPLSALIAPTWTAAPQIDESDVYTDVPHTLPFGGFAGHLHLRGSLLVSFSWAKFAGHAPSLGGSGMGWCLTLAPDTASAACGIGAPGCGASLGGGGPAGSPAGAAGADAITGADDASGAAVMLSAGAVDATVAGGADTGCGEGEHAIHPPTNAQETARVAVWNVMTTAYLKCWVRPRAIGRTAP